MAAEPTSGAAASASTEDDLRLEQFGYAPQLHRVLGFFGNFAVAFTYLSPASVTPTA